MLRIVPGTGQIVDSAESDFFFDQFWPILQSVEAQISGLTPIAAGFSDSNSQSSFNQFVPSSTGAESGQSFETAAPVGSGPAGDLGTESPFEDPSDTPPATPDSPPVGGELVVYGFVYGTADDLFEQYGVSNLPRYTPPSAEAAAFAAVIADPDFVLPTAPPTNPTTPATVSDPDFVYVAPTQSSPTPSPVQAGATAALTPDEISTAFAALAGSTVTDETTPFQDPTTPEDPAAPGDTPSWVAILGPGPHTLPDQFLTQYFDDMLLI